MMKRFFAFVLIMMLCVLCFAGCSNMSDVVDNKNLDADETQIITQSSQNFQFLNTEEMIGMYFYDQLSNVEKSLYCYIVVQLNEFVSEVRFNDMELFGQEISDESMMKVITAVEQDHPEYFWTTQSFGYVTTQTEKIVSFSKKDDAETLKRLLEECDKVGNEILVAIPESSSYEKAKYIYNCLLDMVEYTDQKDQYFDIRGALLNKATNCNGYAHALKFLFDKADIPCIVVYGSTDGGWHAWNAIQLDGQWYWVDSTWGDSTNNRDFYFCMTDSELFTDHTVHRKAAYAGWETSQTFVFPTCTDTKYREWWKH